MNADYDHDLTAWSREQAHLLRAGAFSQLDIIHLAEEIEDLGKRERRALESRLAVLLGHLLKWQFQPDDPNRKSWRATINVQRRSVGKLLNENPSLRPQVDRMIADAYPEAIDLAVAETPFDYGHFPTGCPWDQTQVLSDYLPSTTEPAECSTSKD